MMPDTQTTALPVPGEKKGLPRWAPVIGGFALLIVLAIVIISVIPLPLEGNVKPDIRNEQVYAALAGNGITDAAVDVTGGQVLVSAVMPDTADAVKVKYIVYGAVSQINDPPPVIIVEVFGTDNRLIGTSRVQTSVVHDYVNGKITLEDLDKSIQST
jgi:hypothetical protein